MNGKLYAVDMVIISHLSDAQYSMQTPEEANNHINFAKKLILNYPDTSVEVSEEELNTLWRNAITLDKDSAINAMEQGGYKVAHNSFSEGEYIWTIEEDYFMNEKGSWTPKKDFWELRQGKEWGNGWKIIG